MQKALLDITYFDSFISKHRIEHKKWLTKVQNMEFGEMHTRLNLK